jgi:hypothetical protein
MNVPETVYAMKNKETGKYISAKASGGFIYTRLMDAQNRVRDYNEGREDAKYVVAVLKPVEVPNDVARKERTRYCYLACNSRKFTLLRPKVSYKTYELVEIGLIDA